MTMPAYVPQDFYFKEARRLGYVARSAFKLLEIQKKHKVVPQGARVLDLGCAPGAWLQVACQHLGPITRGGLLVGVDLKKVQASLKYCDQRLSVLQGDVFKLKASDLQKYAPQGYHTIMSDMAPSTSGNDVVDVSSSLGLAYRALEIAVGSLEVQGTGTDTTLGEPGVLVKGGSFVVKILEGSGIADYGKLCKHHFAATSWLRPRATRTASREIYMIAKSKR